MPKSKNAYDAEAEIDEIEDFEENDSLDTENSEDESSDLMEDDDLDEEIIEKTTAGEIGFVIIKTFLLPLLIIAGLIAGAVYVNQFQIVMNIADQQEIHLEYGDNTGLPEVTAAFSGKYFLTNGFQLKVEQSGDADLNKLGLYDITYTTSFQKVTKRAEVHGTVEDTTPPEINRVR